MANKKISESEIILKMRVALDILKQKWQEAEGGWAVADFLECGLNPDKDHWMRAVIEAEELSNSYIEHGK